MESINNHLKTKIKDLRNHLESNIMISIVKKYFKELRDLGENLICNEYAQNPEVQYSQGNLLPALNDLSDLFNIPDFHSYDEQLVRPAIYTYRVYIELVLFQMIRTYGLKGGAWNITEPQLHQIKKIKSNICELALKLKGKPKLADVRFEARCAEQCIKVLKYCSENILSELKILSLGDLKTTIIKVITNLSTSTIEPWYLDVQELRWRSLPITKLELFTEQIEPDINKYINKKHKHAASCAAIYMTIIQRSGIEKALKKRALIGHETLQQLSNRLKTNSRQLLLGETPSKVGLIHLIFRNPKGIWSNISLSDRGWDYYWSMRHTALCYLMELQNSDVIEPEERKLIDQAIRERAKIVNENTPSSSEQIMLEDYEIYREDINRKEALISNARQIVKKLFLNEMSVSEIREKTCILEIARDICESVISKCEDEEELMREGGSSSQEITRIGQEKNKMKEVLSNLKNLAS